MVLGCFLDSKYGVNLCRSHYLTYFAMNYFTNATLEGHHFLPPKGFALQYFDFVFQEPIKRASFIRLTQNLSWRAYQQIVSCQSR